MSVTVDCGEGKHSLCSGQGRTAHLFPQESRSHDEPAFFCGCRCHHDGSGLPCRECARPHIGSLADQPDDDHNGRQP